jgi:Spy/CpxP family protein refolding chaperone
MKKLAALVAALSIVAVAALAYGDMDSRGMTSGMMRGCGMDGQTMGIDDLTILNLNEQQKTSIGAIRSSMMKETIRRTADIRIAQIELQDLLSQDPVDMKAVEAKVRQVGSLRTEMQLAHIKAMEDIKANLTPEQRKKLKDMITAGLLMGGMGMKHDQEHSMMGK